VAKAEEKAEEKEEEKEPEVKKKEPVKKLAIGDLLSKKTAPVKLKAPESTVAPG